MPLHVASRAFLLAAVLALVADVALATATGLVSVARPAVGAPWWVAGHVVERSRWVVLALLVMAAARGVNPGAADAAANVAGIWRAVGVAVVTLPLLWIAAAWIVQAMLFTVAGRWDVDGQIFFAADHYRLVLIGYAPWLIGGAATIAASRHAG